MTQTESIRDNLRRLLVRDCHFWADATALEQKVLIEDAYAVHVQDGIDWSEYANGFESFQTVLDYLAEGWSYKDGVWTPRFACFNGYVPQAQRIETS